MGISPVLECEFDVVSQISISVEAWATDVVDNLRTAWLAPPTPKCWRS